MKDKENDNLGLGSLFKGLNKFIDIMSDMVENEKENVDIKGTIGDSAKGKKVTGSYGFNIKLGAGNTDKIQERVNMIQERVKKTYEYTEPLTDVFEDEEGTVIIMELPGVKAGSINLQAEGNRVIVTASGSAMYRKEIILKSGVNTDGIEAKLNNSIYTIKIRNTTDGREGNGR